MKVYVVKAVRYGDFEKHSYNVGVFSDIKIAKRAGRDEEDLRGGKYLCYVYEFEIDSTLETEAEKDWLSTIEEY